MADNCLLRYLDSSSSSSSTPWGAYSLTSFPESTLWNVTENDALTKALQISLSTVAAADESSSPSASVSASASGSLTIPETRPKSAAASRNPLLPCSASGKISKRKSRASKKSPTTYITADPANFRQMVQQVTGVRFGDDSSSFPVDSAAVIRPEPQRGAAGGSIIGNSHCTAHGILPTLDTSAFLLDRARIVGGSIGPAGAQVSGFDGFSSFPTLESWVPPM